MVNEHHSSNTDYSYVIPSTVTRLVLYIVGTNQHWVCLCSGTCRCQDITIHNVDFLMDNKVLAPVGARTSAYTMLISSWIIKFKLFYLIWARGAARSRPCVSGRARAPPRVSTRKYLCFHSHILPRLFYTWKKYKQKNYPQPVFPCQCLFKFWWNLTFCQKNWSGRRCHHHQPQPPTTTICQPQSPHTTTTTL